MTVRGRYAPSPTGRLHLGNVRTALLSWLQVRAAGGTFILRIEDHDVGRVRPEYDALLQADLRWLGLDWDEGPDVGGPHGPYRQSERDALYAEAVAKLDVYACVCTRKILRETAPPGPTGEPVYPGTCRPLHMPPTPGRAWRWRVPAGAVCARDLSGRVLEEDVAHCVGDFVVRRADGAWAYQLAVVVDDAAMNITHVVRGADLWLSTPRQIALQRALGAPTPVYAHVPLVLGPDGEKLSKRHRAPDVAALRERGVDPGRVVAALARSLGYALPPGARVHPRDLVAGFDLARITAQDDARLDLSDFSGGSGGVS